MTPRRRLEIALRVLSALRRWASDNAPEVLSLVSDVPEHAPLGRLREDKIESLTRQVDDAIGVLSLWGAERHPQSLSLLAEIEGEMLFNLHMTRAEIDESLAIEGAVARGFGGLPTDPAPDPDIANTDAPMCNDIEQQIAYRAYCEAMQAEALQIPTDQRELDLPEAKHVRIRDLGAVIHTAGNGVKLSQMGWGFPPARPGAAPVFNFRSEGRSFRDSNRCIIPASAFYEFTGAKSPKTRHRFTATDGGFVAIAGLWRASPTDGTLDFTLLTTEPGPDVAPIHRRQIVVLPRGDWAAWLYLTKPEADLLRPSPAGAFNVETQPPKAARREETLL
jgi:putative SOS response-associated peptidase YedK